MIDRVLCNLVELNENYCRLALNKEINKSKISKIRITKKSSWNIKDYSWYNKNIEYKGRSLELPFGTLYLDNDNHLGIRKEDIVRIMKPFEGMYFESSLVMEICREPEDSGAFVYFNSERVNKINAMICCIKSSLKPTIQSCTNFLNIALESVLHNLKIIKSIKGKVSSFLVYTV